MIHIRTSLAALLILAAGTALVALIGAADAQSDAAGRPLDLAAAAVRAWQPAEIADWVTLVGVVVTSAVGGLLISARRRAARTRRGVIL